DSPVFHLNAEQIDGLRFATVDMPNFAHITNAYVQFTGLDSVNQLLTFKIVGEVAEDAATFVQAANDISGRPPTSPANDVTWTPPPWTAGDAGADERTPDLAAILQEIIEGGWNSRNAVVLLFTPTAGSGSRNAVSYDGDPFHAPVLVIDYSDPVATVVGPQELPVCVPPDLNPNLPGGAEATDVQLMADCVER